MVFQVLRVQILPYNIFNILEITVDNVKDISVVDQQ